MNTIDITPIVNAAIALIGAGVSVFLIPWLKSQTTEAQRKELTAWVKIGVAAAEQLYKGAGRGEEKKQYVIDFLKQKGFKVDEESVINAIEAAVKQLNTEGLTISNDGEGRAPARPFSFCKGGKPMKNQNTDDIKLKPGETVTDETLDELTGGKGDDNE